MPASLAAAVLRSFGVACRPPSDERAAVRRDLAEQRAGEFDLAAAHEAVDCPGSRQPGCRMRRPGRRGSRSRSCAAMTTAGFRAWRRADGTECSSPRGRRGRLPIICSMTQRLSMRATALVGHLAAIAEHRDGVRNMRRMSSRKCEMKMTLRPLALEGAQDAEQDCSTSGGDSAEVGSSRMMMRAPENSTRANSINCCRPIGREPMRVRGSTSRPRPLQQLGSRASVGHAAPGGPWPSGPTGCLPRKTFSATLRSGHDAEFLVHHADAGRESVARRSGSSPPARRSSCGRRSRRAPRQ